MKKIDLSPIATNVRFPTKKGTWQFLQDSYAECLGALAQSKIGNSYSSSTVYILYGCESSTGGGNTTISAGAVFYNGEVFLSPTQVFATPGGGNVVVSAISTTQYTTNADPVLFSDSVSRNVHNIRQILYSSGPAGGSGVSGYIADYSAFVNADSPFINTGAVFQIISGNTWSNVGSPYYNFGYRVSGNCVDLCGVVTNAIIPGTIPIVNLPVGVRPASDTEQRQFSYKLGSTDFYDTRLYIKANGDVSIDSNASATAIVTLDGIRFRLK
jgi:hypothetical protein